MELIQGDYDNLAGTVIAYSKFLNNDEERIIAQHGSVHKDYFTETMKLPKRKVDQLFDASIGWALENSELIVPFVGFEMNGVDNEKVFSSLNYDVVYGGEFPTKGICKRIVGDTLNEYVRHYSEQLDISPDSNILRSFESKVRYLVKGMVNNSIGGKTKAAYENSEKLMELWKDELSLPLVEELNNYIMESSEKNSFNLDVVEYKLSMALAASEQDFVKANEYKKKLDNL